MAISLNQAQTIVQKLSNEQLMKSYTDGSLPQFIVFSEMQRRQQAANSSAKMPTRTVAEQMVGDKDAMEGISSIEPQFAAKGGITRVSPLDMGYSEDLPPEARKIIAMRLRAMKDIEQPDEIPQYAAEGGILESQVPSSTDKINPLTSREIADMLLNPVKMTESGGRQSAISPKGARGVMQIMPKTGPEAAKLAGLPWDYNKYANDEAYNTKLGHAYLTSMIDRFGDTEKALAAYNWGPTNLSKALQKASDTGRDWKSFLPKETSDYIGKVLGENQKFLPQRQDASETDLPSKGPYIDESFLPQGVRSVSPPSYDYGTGQDNQAKGLSALRIAQAVNQMGRPPLNRNVGGPVFLDGGSDGSPTSSGLTPEPTRDYALDENERLAAEELNRKIKEQRELEQKYGDQGIESADVRSILERRAKSARESKKAAIQYPSEQQQIYQTGPYGDVLETTPPGWTPPPSAQAGSPRLDSSGIPSVLPGGKSPFTGPEPAPGSFEYRTADETLKAMRERDAALRGPSAGGDTLTPRIDLSDDQKQGISFNTVMDQVRQSVGSNLSNEFLEQKKDFQKNLESMKNDKIVDTLMAAAKTLAGQRKGQVNFGDVVANAGLAAQEAQKRIYKAEDDMRKYRLDLLKAQDEGNYKAANIAMQRINNERTNMTHLQTAIQTTNRMIASQTASEKRTNIGVASRELTTMLAARNKLESDINRYKSDPMKTQDVQGWEAERNRLDAQIAGARQQLNYFQTGQDFSAIEAEARKRGLIP